MSFHQGMSIIVRQRFSRGLQFQANYTWSHTLDVSTDSNGDGAPMHPYNWRLAYGNSNWAPPVYGEFIKSRGNRCLVQPATVFLPAIRGKAYRRPRSARIRQTAFYPRVRPVLIEILLELSQLRLQVCGCPE